MTQQKESENRHSKTELRDWLISHDCDNFFLLKEQCDIGKNLLQLDAAQGWLSQGLPSLSFSGHDQFVDYVFWFPNGIPNGNSIHLASSRIGRQPEQKPQIFEALRTLATRISGDQRFLISHGGTTLHDYINRLSFLFDIPIVNFERFPPRVDSDWFIRTLNSTAQHVCYYQSLHDDEQTADELLMQSTTEARVLSARLKGNISKQTLKRLSRDVEDTKSDSSTQAKTFVLVDSKITSKQVQMEFRNAGAIEWWLYKDDTPENSKTESHQSIYSLSELHQQVSIDEYMIHWTRQRSGPWPNQTQDQFVDDLLLGLDSQDHSRIATLSRIVASRHLHADSQLCRDKTPVVCFADVAVDEVLQRRVFRSHVGRWDFEPCGIAIRKSVLKKLGAKPVIYGDDDTWASLAEEHRPFFQLAVSRSGKNEIDWTQEREHRIRGNVSLQQIASNDAFLFVESRQEAEKVAPLSRWPVVQLTNK